MGSLRDRLFTTPRRVILFFFPAAVLVPLAVYALTLVRYLFPGEVSAHTARAAGLCGAPDLADPFFHLVAGWVARLPFGALPARLSLFAAVCAALAAGLFYLLAAHLFFGLAASENAGNAVQTFLFLDRPPDEEEGDRPETEKELQVATAHNLRAAAAAALGGLCAAAALAFCPPFWICATRLLPHGFNLALFFLVANLAAAYVRGGKDASLFPGIFLAALFAAESPLHLLLFFFAAAVLIRSLILNGKVNTCRVFGVLVFGAAGGVLSWLALRSAAGSLPAPPAGNKALFHLFLETAWGAAVRWVPDYGWGRSVLFLLLPSALAVGIAQASFRRRTVGLFVLQLALAAALAPSLFNLDFSLWGAGRQAGRLPVFSFVLIALYAGLLVSSWFLMRGGAAPAGAAGEGTDEEEETDVYEMEDSRAVARIGSLLCWPAAVALLAAPFRSFVDVDPRAGVFADRLVEAIAERLRPGDCLVNARHLRYPLLLSGHMHGKPMHAVAASSGFLDATVSPALAGWIRGDPSFGACRTELLNRADISTAGFLRGWARCDTNAYRRVALFADTALLGGCGYEPLPSGFFMRFAPGDAPPDSLALLREHRAFVEEVRPLLAERASDRDPVFVRTRREGAAQLALIGNELGCLLARQGHPAEAAGLFREMEAFDPDNLSLLFNQYQLAVFNGAGAERLPEIKGRLKAIPGRIDIFGLSGGGVALRHGSLIDPDVLAHIRRNVWIKELSFRALLGAGAGPGPAANPLAAIRNKLRDMRWLVTNHLEANDDENAGRILDILLDLDEKDVFVMVNKARIALLKGDLADAGVWMDLARENGAKPDDLLWHEAAMLYLSGRKKEAKAFLNRCLPDHSGDVHLWGLMAQILIDEKGFDELETRVYQALRNATAHKEHYLFFWIRGLLLERAGNAAAARTAYLNALRLNPHFDALRERLLLLDERIGIPSFSEEDAKAFLRIRPDHPFADYLLGMARIHAGEWALAEDLFTRSLRRARLPGALAGLGAALLEQGRPGEAEKAVRESLRMDPSRAFARLQMARILLATDRPAEAEKEADAALKLAPNLLDANLTLCRILIRQGRFEEAADRLAPLVDRQESLPPKQRTQVGLLDKQLREKLGI